MSTDFYFTKENTFCISLDSRSDRWVLMENMFRFFGLDVCRWSASTFSADIFADYLSAPQRGCSQSHINIWRHIIKHKLDYAFIMEDDARLDYNWKEKLSAFSSSTSVDDILHNNNNNNNNHNRENTTTTTTKQFDILLLNASEPISPPHQWAKQEEQYLTGGYILSFEGAVWLLSNFSGCFYSADWMTSRLLTNGRGYSYFPWLIIQEGKDSTIGNQCEQDHAKVVRCLGNINYSIENNYWKP